MKYFRLDDMTRGWFCGDFIPTVFNTKDCEVGVKHYKAGDYEPHHVHKIATEITCIISGCAQMNGKGYWAGDIIVIEPGDGTDFRAITPVTNVVVKIPSVKGDKYVE